MLPWLLCGVLALAAVYFAGKVRALHRTMEELEDQLAHWLDRDSNNRLTLSGSRDPYARRLALTLDRQLAELRRHRRQWQKGDQELKEAVANLSHDLRTPLTALGGYLELLEGTELSPAQGRYLAQIQGRMAAMRELTEELFRYSVLTAAQPLARTPVVLNQVLEESLLAHYAALTRRGITPALDLTEVPVRRTLDPAALQRIFANLLSNALKYSRGDLAVTLTPAGEITFANTAPGLTPVQVERLFHRFYTVETGRDGTGLGLSIARLLTESMGGTIQAAWQEGKLILTLTFPAEDP